MATTLNPVNHRTNSNTFFVVTPKGDLQLRLPLSLPVFFGCHPRRGSAVALAVVCS
jgi:hypothetical protein